MDNYKQKLIKYLKKLSSFAGGVPLKLRSFLIEIIFDDIKKLIFEYAKEFNSLSYDKQQLKLQSRFKNVDFTDNTIQTILDNISIYLPSFSLIWDSYYETLILDKSYLFLNYPNDKPPSQNEILKIIENNIDYFKIAYESFNKKEIRNDIFKIGSKSFRKVTRPRYEDPIFIKSPDSDDIIPMSEFCKTGYSKLLNCENNKCSKIHFPDAFNKDALCSDDPGCRNFENKMCSQYHAKQGDDLVFDTTNPEQYTKEHLIGIKKSSLSKLPIKKDTITFKDGRIVFQDEPEKEKKPIPIPIPTILPSNPLDHTLREYLDRDESESDSPSNVRPAPSRERFSLESLDEPEKEIETIGRFRPNYGTEEDPIYIEPIYEELNKKTKRGTNSNSRRKRRLLTESELASELILNNEIIKLLNTEFELLNNDNTMINEYFQRKYKELLELRNILDELKNKLGDDEDIIIQITNLRKEVRSIFVEFELFLKESNDELIKFKKQISNIDKNNLDKSSIKKIIEDVIKKRIEIRDKYNKRKFELDDIVSKYSYHLYDIRKHYSYLFKK
jgi:hypothetical protein